MSTTTRENGGPAFPFVLPPDFQFAERGMSLRDYFAAQALVGMMQAMNPYSGDFERSANAAYEQADAMIKAREA